MSDTYIAERSECTSSSQYMQILRAKQSLNLWEQLAKNFISDSKKYVMLQAAW